MSDQEEEITSIAPITIRQLCDHESLISLFKSIEDKMSVFDRVFQDLHREVVHYPASGHPRYLPNQITFAHDLLKELKTKVAELSGKIEINKWIEAEGNVA